jgi:hypothetical protein
MVERIENDHEKMMTMMILVMRDIRHAHNTPHSLTQTYCARTHAYMHTRSQSREQWKHVPNTLLHSAKGIQADSNGQSKRLSMSGQPRGPGGSGRVDARRRRIRNATVRIATRT